MTAHASSETIIPALDEATTSLVRLAAVITAGSEPELRDEARSAANACDPVWVEELILQSYLFAGFPRALNAAREWRKVSGRPAPPAERGGGEEGPEFGYHPEWKERGEATCAVVYGKWYEPLRKNIRGLHPALDAWMIVDGYGKVLGRPGLDLKRRELCVVAACAAAGQDRQLHSHLHGALNAGASEAEVSSTLDAIADLMKPADIARTRHLWARVRNVGR
ncbi:MAG: hypothetical protein NVS1B4_15510 [Gemmatimonadaceae bacterium]